MSREVGPKLLLDEHYPPWLADDLVNLGVDCTAVAGEANLRGLDDSAVLGWAAQERRSVVTEDVATFAQAVADVPDHVGVIYCHHARYPRTRPGLEKLKSALCILVANPPSGMGSHPVIWWLPEP